MLEDGDLFMAVHALDLEDRLGVQFADRTSAIVAFVTSLEPLLLDVRQRLPQQLDDVLVVERVEDQPARHGDDGRAACRAAGAAGVTPPTR